MNPSPVQPFIEEKAKLKEERKSKVIHEESKEHRRTISIESILRDEDSDVSD